MPVLSVCLCSRLSCGTVSMGELGTAVGAANGGMHGSQLTATSNVKKLLKVSHCFSVVCLCPRSHQLLGVQDTMRHSAICACRGSVKRVPTNLQQVVSSSDALISEAHLSRSVSHTYCVPLLAPAPPAVCVSLRSSNSGRKKAALMSRTRALLCVNTNRASHQIAGPAFRLCLQHVHACVLGTGARGFPRRGECVTTAHALWTRIPCPPCC